MLHVTGGLHGDAGSLAQPGKGKGAGREGQAKAAGAWQGANAGRKGRRLDERMG